jgi:hypothetical protein
MSPDIPHWLRGGPLSDLGDLSAVYPYSMLRGIESEGDVRRAVFDETEQVEREFGPDAVKSLYRMIWLLNCAAGVFTSHVAVGMKGCMGMPGYEWASHSVGVMVSILSRQRSEQFSQPAAKVLATALLQLLLQNKSDASECQGWSIIVRPEVVRYAYSKSAITQETPLRKGFGCELMINGFGNSRPAAAKSWSDACRYLANTLRKRQAKDRFPALPHLHFQNLDS